MSEFSGVFERDGRVEGAPRESVAEVSRLRAEVGRLTTERDEALEAMGLKDSSEPLAVHVKNILRSANRKQQEALEAQERLVKAQPVLDAALAVNRMEDENEERADEWGRAFRELREATRHYAEYAKAKATTS